MLFQIAIGSSSVVGFYVASFIQLVAYVAYLYPLHIGHRSSLSYLEQLVRVIGEQGGVEA